MTTWRKPSVSVCIALLSIAFASASVFAESAVNSSAAFPRTQGGPSLAPGVLPFPEIPASITLAQLLPELGKPVKLDGAENAQSLSVDLPSLPASAAPAPTCPAPAVASPEPGCLGKGAFGDFCPPVWGIVGLKGYPTGEHVAPNGVRFQQIFSTDLSFNMWLWRQQHLYLFVDSVFWAQKAAPGITNSSQGAFDFSKREYDLTPGIAWNYWGPLEGRVFAYSFNNLNRGDSAVSPAGFNDGVGIENRFYINSVYKNLGTADFDQPRASFLSVGYYPTKDMVDATGNSFKPGLSLRAYLTYDLWGPKCYWYGDTTFLTSKSISPTLLTIDTGLAARPIPSAPRWEFRVGLQEILDLHNSANENSVYLGISYIF